MKKESERVREIDRERHRERHRETETDRHSLLGLLGIHVIN